ncbi:AAA family ATPase [Antrihabitans sp. YC2-6]|uniref:bifunctional aminoglycoside phosphotransferase/ATP-binding protein n=1 Tax=Antrihabitans sp. YC2-6 TaxID=2799498 RepID=UPI0018F7CFCD|nr:AAA family ATPase [Antrihabitans sp. YC2-6]MBJ8347015.1 AAA family ATPase [Antrihabitans sp. YC2-6]
MPDKYAEVRETHTGVVLLVGDRALKAKKPCRMAFLDFSTAALREAACARELELNRRLAADVYLGVGHLSDPLGGPSEPILMMRRMPEHSRLATMIAGAEPVEAQLGELAAMIAAFHTTAKRGPDIDRQGTVEFVRIRWEANLREIAALNDGSKLSGLSEIDFLAMRYLAGREKLFARRIMDSRIVDGHGDLSCEDVFCLPDGPRALDCLDFDDALRFVDGIDDVCFLAMDLEFRGRPDLSRLFLDGYVEAAQDSVPASLIGHYVAYRALVRAKVELIRAGQGESRSIETAEEYRRLAVEHLRQGTVRLCTVGGLPGTGKTTVGTALAGMVGATLISSDRVRKELVADGVIDGQPGMFGRGLYSPDTVAFVYKTMLERASALLENGISVVLDASWTDDERRSDATALAKATDSFPISLHCVAPAHVAALRISRRDRGDSDATPDIAVAMAGRRAASGPESTLIDTSGSIEASVAAATEAWYAI